MDNIIGAGVTLGLGVIIVAVIYNLTTNSGGTTLVNDTLGPTGFGQTTVGDLFK